VLCVKQNAATATGLLFPDQELASLQAALAAFEDGQLWRLLPAERLRCHAETFAPQVFRARLQLLLQKLWDNHNHDPFAAVPVV
jgi:hypothetical protein